MSLIARPNFATLAFPTLKRPSKKLLLIAFVVVFFLVTGSTVYNIIISPPSIGSENVGGKQKPVTVMKRLNAAYIIESYTASTMFCLCALGIVLVYLSMKPDQENASFLLTAGAMMCLIGFSVLMVFLKIKVPGYLKR
ncbi:hypothetical protein PCE1_002871 [Barthelona sp. PCE]